MAAVTSQGGNFLKQKYAPKPAGQRGQNGQRLSALRFIFSGGAPGMWASRHLEELQHNTGWNFCAVSAFATQLAGEDVRAYRRRTRRDVDRVIAGGDADTPAGIQKRIDRLVGKARPNRKSRRAARSRWRSVAKTFDPSHGWGAQDRKPLGHDHPLVKLMRRPNKHQSGAVFRYQIGQQLALTGTALIWIVRDERDVPRELYIVPTGLALPQGPNPTHPEGWYQILPMASYSVAPDADGFEPASSFGSLLSLGGEIDKRDVLAIKWPHPYLLTDGLSPLAAGAVQIDIAEAIDRSIWSRFKNEGRPGIVWKWESAEIYREVDKEEREAFKSDLRNQYSGPDNVGKDMIAPPGLEPTPFAPNPKEMDFANTRPQARDGVFALHQTPATIAGASEATSYAQLFASLKQYTMLKIQPTLDLIFEELSEWLCPGFGDGYMLEAKARSIDDPTLAAQRLERLYSNRLVTFDEGRALEDLPPFPDPEIGRLQVGTPPPGQGGPGGPGGPDGLMASLLGGGGPDAGPGAAPGSPTDTDTGTAQPFDQQAPAGGFAAKRVRGLVTKAAGAARYGHVSVPIRGELAERVKQFARTIAPRDVAAKGLEPDLHVTVCWGLATVDPEEVFRVVRAFGPVRLTLGTASLFENDDVDVLKVDVAGDDLYRLNDALCDALPHVDTFAYKPHVTVAYLKPGRGGRYAGWDGIDGESVTARELVFSDRMKNRTVLPLRRVDGVLQKAADPDRRRPVVGALQASDDWLHRQAQGERAIGAAATRFLTAYAGDFYRSVIESLATGGEPDFTTAAAAFDARAFAAGMADALTDPMTQAARRGALLEWQAHGPADRQAAADLKGVGDAAEAAARKRLDSRYWNSVAAFYARHVMDAAKAAPTDGSRPFAIAVAGTFGGPRAATKGAALGVVESTNMTGLGQDVGRALLADAGVKVTKQWVCKCDGRERPTHREAHGQIVGIDEPFVVGGHECDRPGDPSLPPAERENCRCHAVTIVPDLPAKRKGFDGSAAPTAEGPCYSCRAKRILKAGVSAPAHLVAGAKAIGAAALRVVEKRHGTQVKRAVAAAVITSLPIPMPGMEPVVAAPILAFAGLHRKLFGKGREKAVGADPKLVRTLARGVLVKLFGDPLPPAVLPAKADPVGKALDGLVEKGFTGQVTAKNGVVYHYVDGKRVAGHEYHDAAEKHHASGQQAPPPTKAQSAAALQHAAEKPHELTHDHVAALPDHLDNMNMHELRAIKKKLGAVPGSSANKAPLMAAIHNWLAEKSGHAVEHFQPGQKPAPQQPAATPAPATPAAPAGVDPKLKAAVVAIVDKYGHDLQTIAEDDAPGSFSHAVKHLLAQAFPGVTTDAIHAALKEAVNDQHAFPADHSPAAAQATPPAAPAAPTPAAPPAAAPPTDLKAALKQFIEETDEHPDTGAKLTAADYLKDFKQYHGQIGMALEDAGIDASGKEIKAALADLAGVAPPAPKGAGGPLHPVLAKAVADAKSLTAEELAQVPGLLNAMDMYALRALKKQLGAKGDSSYKAKMTAAIHDHLKAQVGTLDTHGTPPAAASADASGNAPAAAPAHPPKDSPNSIAKLVFPKGVDANDPPAVSHAIMMLKGSGFLGANSWDEIHGNVNGSLDHLKAILNVASGGTVSAKSIDDEVEFQAHFDATAKQHGQPANPPAGPADKYHLGGTLDGWPKQWDSSDKDLVKVAVGKAIAHLGLDAAAIAADPDAHFKQLQNVQKVLGDHVVNGDTASLAAIADGATKIAAEKKSASVTGEPPATPQHTPDEVTQALHKFAQQGHFADANHLKNLVAPSGDQPDFDFIAGEMQKHLPGVTADQVKQAWDSLSPPAHGTPQPQAVKDAVTEEAKKQGVAHESWMVGGWKLDDAKKIHAALAPTHPNLTVLDVAAAMAQAGADAHEKATQQHDQAHANLGLYAKAINAPHLLDAGAIKLLPSILNGQKLDELKKAKAKLAAGVGTKTKADVVGLLHKVIVSQHVASVVATKPDEIFGDALKAQGKTLADLKNADGQASSGINFPDLYAAAKAKLPAGTTNAAISLGIKKLTAAVKADEVKATKLALADELMKAGMSPYSTLTSEAESMLAAAGKKAPLAVVAQALLSLKYGSTTNNLGFKPHVAESSPAATTSAPPAYTPVSPTAKAKAADVPTYATPAGFPTAPTDLTYTKDLGGSTGAKQYQDAGGNLFAVKKGNSAEHVKEEFYADKAYQALGFAVPEVALYDAQGASPTKVAAWVHGKDLGTYLSTATPEQKKAVYAEIAKGFAADCLFGNWDVVGQTMDNIKVADDGTVYRIDNGGSFRFRAMGKQKTSNAWKPEVTELETMRDSSKNTHGAEIYKSLTDDDIKAQVKDLLAKKDALLAAVPKDVRTMLEKRLNWMKENVLAEPPDLSQGVEGSIYFGASNDWVHYHQPDQSKTYAPKPSEVGNTLFKDYGPTEDRGSGTSHGGLPKSFMDHTKATIASLTPEQRDASRTYTGGFYSALNSQMRQCPELLDCLSPKQKEVAKGAEESMAKNGVLAQPITVWRNISLNAEDTKKLYAACEHAAKNGLECRFPGIKSCSIGVGNWHGNVMFEVRAKTGMYVKPISLHPGENEFFQGHNVRYRCAGVKEVPFNGSKKKVIMLEEI